jgi:iron complex transport system permease protein
LKNLKRHALLFSLLFVGLLILFVANISLGSIAIPFKEVYNSLTGAQASKSTWEYIIINYRLPKAY